ncbi:MAG: hypothetical protein H8E72_01200 [Candidatus Marinimicrobia bacterium]|nr:hypothetical protein [Candidatus Neomarinimicrobiota bacterium]
MCRHRFGVLNDLHNELVAEGINDIHFMGMNGFQYLDDSNVCMMCSDPDLCSNCEDTRHLPWTQDFDDGLNCAGDNVGLCEADDTLGDVWDMWDVTLRDLVILDRDGRYVTRINLTATNPDPSSTCGQNYDTIKELLISIRNQ